MTRLKSILDVCLSDRRYSIVDFFTFEEISKSLPGGWTIKKSYVKCGVGFFFLSPSNVRQRTVRKAHEYVVKKIKEEKQRIDFELMVNSVGGAKTRQGLAKGDHAASKEGSGLGERRSAVLDELNRTEKYFNALLVLDVLRDLYNEAQTKAEKNMRRKMFFKGVEEFRNRFISDAFDCYKEKTLGDVWSRGMFDEFLPQGWSFNIETSEFQFAGHGVPFPRPQDIVQYFEVSEMVMCDSKSLSFFEELCSVLDGKVNCHGRIIPNCRRSILTDFENLSKSFLKEDSFLSKDISCLVEPFTVHNGVCNVFSILTYEELTASAPKGWNFPRYYAAQKDTFRFTIAKPPHFRARSIADVINYLKQSQPLADKISCCGQKRRYSDTNECQSHADELAYFNALDNIYLKGSWTTPEYLKGIADFKGRYVKLPVQNTGSRAWQIGMFDNYLPNGWTYDMYNLTFCYCTFSFKTARGILETFENSEADYLESGIYQYFKHLWQFIENKVNVYGRLVPSDHLDEILKFMAHLKKTCSCITEDLGEYAFERRSLGKQSAYTFEQNTQTDEEESNGHFDFFPDEIELVDEAEETPCLVGKSSADQAEENPFIALGVDCLIHVFSFLTVDELFFVSLVCKEWRCVANQCELWKTPMFGGLKIKRFDELMKAHGKHITCLDLRMALPAEGNRYIDPTKSLFRFNFLQYGLKKLFLENIPFSYAEQVCRTFPNLTSLHLYKMFSLTATSRYLFKPIGLSKMTRLNELIIHSEETFAFDTFQFGEGEGASVAIEELGALSNLCHFELYGVLSTYRSPLEYLKKYTKLTTFSFGPCDQLWSEDFNVIGQLEKLQCLSLFHGNCTTSMKLASAIARMKNLQFVHFSDFACTEEIAVALGEVSCLKQFHLNPYLQEAEDVATEASNINFEKWMFQIWHLQQIETLDLEIYCCEETVLGYDTITRELLVGVFANMNPALLSEEFELTPTDLHRILEVVLPNTRVNFSCSEYSFPDE
eukprot:Nk52_evm26s2402 gene=Nk52_evmTU26s2402